MIKLKELLNYLIIVVMATILAFIYQLFIVENNFAPAGLNGIATMVQYKTGLSKVTASGSYTNDEKTVLICVVNRHQITDLKEILIKYQDTFSFSEIVSEVYGNFKQIR